MKTLPTWVDRLSLGRLLQWLFSPLTSRWPARPYRRAALYAARTRASFTVYRDPSVRAATTPVPRARWGMRPRARGLHRARRCALLEARRRRRGPLGIRR